MRLICSIPGDLTQENPYAFSYFLKSQKIENECEEAIAPDGKANYLIWVHDEDRVEEALQYYEEYRNNPKDSRFRSIDWESLQAAEKTAKEEEHPPQYTAKAPPRRQRFLSPSPYGFLTIIILITVSFLFFWAGIQGGIKAPPKFPGVADAPIFPPIDKALLFDYPQYFILRDELIKAYPSSEQEKGHPPPEEALSILLQMEKTPFWSGFYDQLVSYFHNKHSPFSFKAPLFEKIRQFQIWRLWTPALLHFDLLHIFFNVLWFIMLGNQIEYRLGFFRYGILIGLAALLTNTAQYFMSGSFFMGLSGIVCAQAGFIWARQQVAPWEGYLLHRLTLLFLALFVVGMFFLQVIFFFLQITGQYNGGIPIANTAHLVGGLMGYLCGRLRLFSIRHRH